MPATQQAKVNILPLLSGYVTQQTDPYRRTFPSTNAMRFVHAFSPIFTTLDKRRTVITTMTMTPGIMAIVGDPKMKNTQLQSDAKNAIEKDINNSFIVICLEVNIY